MGTIADLHSDVHAVSFGNDSVVIRHYIAGIKGGRTLDMTGFLNDTLRAGHVIIHNTADDTYKPMPLVSDGDVYDALPDGYEYAGVLTATILSEHPFAGIMYAGEVNDEASPYPVTDIKDAMKEALPQLVFMHD